MSVPQNKKQYIVMIYVCVHAQCLGYLKNAIHPNAIKQNFTRQRGSRRKTQTLCERKKEGQNFEAI